MDLKCAMFCLMAWLLTGVALAEEVAHPAHEVWVALRADGKPGTGTQADLKQMYRHVNDTPVSELGDSLLRFIAIEAWEGGQLSDGTVDAEIVCHALGRGAEELGQVLIALAAAIAQE